LWKVKVPLERPLGSGESGGDEEDGHHQNQTYDVAAGHCAGLADKQVKLSGQKNNGRTERAKKIKQDPRRYDFGQSGDLVQ
jgi:hypothetical protein